MFRLSVLTLAPYHYICARGVRRQAAPRGPRPRRRPPQRPRRAPSPAAPRGRARAAAPRARTASQLCRRCARDTVHNIHIYASPDRLINISYNDML